MATTAKSKTTKPAAKSAKPAAKTAKPAAKSAKPAAKTAKPADKSSTRLLKNGLFNALFSGTGIDGSKSPKASEAKSSEGDKKRLKEYLTNLRSRQQWNGGKLERPAYNQVATMMQATRTSPQINLTSEEREAIVDSVWPEFVKRNPPKRDTPKKVSRNSTQQVHKSIEEAARDLRRKEKSTVHKAFLIGVEYASSCAANGIAPSRSDIAREKSHLEDK